MKTLKLPRPCTLACICKIIWVSDSGQVGGLPRKFQSYPLGEASRKIMLNFNFTKDFPVNWKSNEFGSRKTICASRASKEANQPADQPTNQPANQQTKQQLTKQPTKHRAHLPNYFQYKRLRPPCLSKLIVKGGREEGRAEYKKLF